MHIRHSGNGGIGADTREPGDMPNGEVGMMTRAERLDYIAEMAWELRGMAVQAGCRTLTDLLEVAAKEARLRRHD